MLSAASQSSAILNALIARADRTETAHQAPACRQRLVGCSKWCIPLGKNGSFSSRSSARQRPASAQWRMSAARAEFDVPARLAKAVLRDRRRTTAQVDQVTSERGGETRRRAPRRLHPCRHQRAAEAAASYGIGGLLSYEMERARLDAAFLGQFNSSGDELWHGGLTLGAAYLFNAGNTSPYVGASLGYGATWMGSDVDDADFGLLTSVGGGVEFFRLYRARMLIDGVTVNISLRTVHRSSGCSASCWRCAKVSNAAAPARGARAFQKPSRRRVGQVRLVGLAFAAARCVVQPALISRLPLASTKYGVVLAP